MVSIIIPTYKHLEDCLKPCIESIIRHTKMDQVEVIVVANGLNDGTREYIWQKGDRFSKSLFFDEQIGFTKAVNEGIKVSTGDYVLILNNDVVVLGNDWISQLIKPFDTMDNVGITGPMKVMSPHIKRKFIIFFCAMISRVVINKVGLLDEAFSPGFCEDNDYCARVEDAGYQLVQVPNEVYTMDGNHMKGQFPIFHKGNVTFRETGKKGSEGFERNIQLLKDKWNKLKIEKARTLDGYLPEREMLWLADQARKYKSILEVGSWHGRSTRALADNTDGVVYAVDTWFGSDDEPKNHGSAYMLKGDHAFMEFYEGCREHIESGKIRPIRMHSGNAAKILKDKKFDMVFIDGDHTYEGCKADIENYFPLATKLICGHDYQAWHGVSKAVDEKFGKDCKKVFTIWYKELNEPKVFDCFLFYNELELLEVRLNELDDVVDEFILVESTLTTTGKPKPLYFTENKDRFAKFLPKIRCVVLDDLPPQDTWTKERYARDKFKELVKGKDGDIVLISDADEIPTAEAIRKYKPEMGLRSFDQRLYYYWLNCDGGSWDWGKIIGYTDFMKMTPCQIRYTNAPKIEGNGGWHFTFQGGAERIMDKIQAWTHSEYNRPDIVNKEWITEAINTPKDVLRRTNIPLLKYVPLDDSFPKFVRDNMDKFKSWIK